MCLVRKEGIDNVNIKEGINNVNIDSLFFSLNNPCPIYRADEVTDM